MGPEGLQAILSILTRFPEVSILWLWELLCWRTQGEQDYRDEAECKMNKSSVLKPLLSSCKGSSGPSDGHVALEGPCCPRSVRPGQ